MYYLTKNQYDIIKKTAEGKSHKEVAYELKKGSAGVIGASLCNLKEKLGVETTQELVELYKQGNISYVKKRGRLADIMVPIPDE